MYLPVLLSALLACAAGVPFDSTKPRLGGRIVGGTETNITSHPYQVSLLLRGSYRCGGTIIRANWVATLAYCVSGYSTSELFVRSGSTYSNSGGTIHGVTRILLHEKWDEFLDYDFALVQVSPAFTFSASVQPIALECYPVPVGTDVVITGWGYDPEIDGYPSTILREVALKTISASECNSTSPFNITDSMICAKDPNGVKGACRGDYGSPLVASNRLVGLYSISGVCDDNQSPDVYTKLAAVCYWIVINIGP